MDDNLAARGPAAVTAASCPVCGGGTSKFHARIDGYDYFQCADCQSLYIDTATIDMIDAGKSTRIYDENYWKEELRSARERAAGVSLVRAGEAILYARRPVERFLDVGTGPGYLLDALARHFPGHPDMFHGVELFPPEEHSSNPNYRVGDVADLLGTFDAGTCIEVAEHLTPAMLKGVARGLAAISKPGTLWLFNTGMPEYVIEEDPGYLDPLRRGHIVSYGLRGVAHLFETFGFRISPIPGRSYAWFAEFEPAEILGFGERIYHPLPENRKLLEESGLLFQAAFESARTAFYMDQAVQESRWALSLKSELEAARGANAELRAERELSEDRKQCLHGGSPERHAVLATQLSELTAAHEQILNSRSWRLTRPLRAAARWARGFRQRAIHGD